MDLLNQNKNLIDDEISRKRAYHAVSENERVKKLKKLLKLMIYIF